MRWWRASADPQSARAMAERSRSFVLDRYDWDTLADRLERVWFAVPRQGNAIEGHALIVTQVMTSPFFGGPERLVLGLTQSLARGVRLGVSSSSRTRGRARHFASGSSSMASRRSRSRTTHRISRPWYAS